MSDLISRAEAIDAPEKFIKDCNPDHFVGHQKFIEYMDNAEIRSFGKWQFANGFNMGLTAAEVVIKKLPSAQPEGYVRIPETGIDDLSDGFHTFRQLYYQRMMLFATIVKQNREKAWKSLRHEDGELCFGGDWFIVGIDTPEGTYTYHYEANYYSMFDCKELERARHWDGHTEKDVTRLLSLPSAQQWHTGEPTEDGDYLVFDTEEYYTIDAYYTHNGTEEYGAYLAYKGWQSCNHVKYWMPIPEAPEVEK